MLVSLFIAAPAHADVDLRALDLVGGDKVLHAGASLALTDLGWAVAGALDAPLWARAAAGVSVAAAAGLAKESADLLGLGTPSLGDLTYDALGIAAGVGVALAAESVLRRLDDTDDTDHADTATTRSASAACSLAPAPARLAARAP